MSDKIMGEITSLNDVEFLNLLVVVGKELRSQASGRGMYEASVQLERLVFACSLLLDGVAMRGRTSVGDTTIGGKPRKLRETTASALR